MISGNQAIQNTGLTLQGCGYKIDNDRVTISIQRIANDRGGGNLSGTLCLQLCAFEQYTERHTEAVLASTTIGEIKGQHCLVGCDYDLVFQPPAAGVWQFSLQLCEWDGVAYTLCDTVYFDLFYQVPAIQAETTTQLDNPITESLTPSPKAPTEKKGVKKNTIGYSNGYVAINKSKVEKLLNVKGVPKKVLGKLAAERPFHSEKAVLNVKGMGPAMLSKVLAELTK